MIQSFLLSDEIKEKLMAEFLAFFAQNSVVQVGLIRADSAHEADMLWRPYLSNLNRHLISYSGETPVELPKGSGVVAADMTHVMHYPSRMICAVEFWENHYLIAFTLVGKGPGKVSPIHVEKFELPRTDQPVSHVSFFELHIKPRYSKKGEISDEEVEEYLDTLGNLAGEWRGRQPSRSQSLDLALDVVQEYERVFLELLERGWNLTGLDIESLLPAVLMPERAFQIELPTTESLIEEVRGFVKNYATSIRQLVYVYGYDRCLTRLVEMGWSLDQITADMELADTELTLDAYYQRNRW